MKSWKLLMRFVEAPSEILGPPRDLLEGHGSYQSPNRAEIEPKPNQKLIKIRAKSKIKSKSNQNPNQSPRKSSSNPVTNPKSYEILEKSLINRNPRTSQFLGSLPSGHGERLDFPMALGSAGLLPHGRPPPWS